MIINVLYYSLGNAIPYVEKLRDLGLIVDSNLSFDQHRLNIVKKLFRLVNLFCKSFEARGAESFVKLYKCYVFPLLDYCCHLYFPLTAKSIKLIEGIQQSVFLAQNYLVRNMSIDSSVFAWRL